MTFCVGMKVRKGLVGIADTLVTTGSESITARKVTIHQYGRHSLLDRKSTRLNSSHRL